VLDAPHQTKKQRLRRVLVATAVLFPGHSQFAFRDRTGLVKTICDILSATWILSADLKITPRSTTTR